VSEAPKQVATAKTAVPQPTLAVQRTVVPPKITTASMTTPQPTESQNEPAPVQSDPIVLIEDHRDAQTGANKATEVSASNVLIGG